MLTAKSEYENKAQSMLLYLATTIRNDCGFRNASRTHWRPSPSVSAERKEVAGVLSQTR